MLHKLLLTIILASALFLRTYRTTDLLGFWYDQGRDAQVIWNLIHNKKLFLVGPTTGIEGIFLGPFYYYLITPAYLLGGGNPVYPAVFLAILNTLAIYVLYRIGREYFSPGTGLLAAALVSWSFELAHYHRWLSNPTPLPLFALITFWALLKIVHSSPGWAYWAVLGLGVGLSLQLEAASAIFFIPSIAIALFINRKLARPAGGSIIALGVFFLTLLPQILFNFRHQNILLNSFSKFLISDRSFQAAPTNFLATRLAAFYQFFSSKLFPSESGRLFFVLSLAVLSTLAYRLIKRKATTAALVWLAVPMVSLLFYHGNRGYVWDYYFTGVFPIFMALISALSIAAFARLPRTRTLLVFLAIVFVFQNFPRFQGYLSQKLPGYISLTPQLQAIDWIYGDAAGNQFNTDVYVPPVIPLAYDYLFLWRGTSKYGYLPTQDKLLTRLYTIQEPDLEHPTLLNNWLTRQTYYSSMEVTQNIGPLTVQRRYRHKFE